DERVDRALEPPGRLPGDIAARPRRLAREERAVGRSDAEPEPGRAREDDEHREESFREHRAETDELGVRLRTKLLARGAAPDEAMKAADRAAGDRDEEERKHHRRAGGIP